MEHPIVEKILKDGINSVNLSMLDEAARKRILSDVGEKLYKQSKFSEAVEMMAKAGDTEKLAMLGDSFLEENKIELATLCFIPTKDKQRLNNAAVLCIQSKKYGLAAKAYEAADNRQMAFGLGTVFSLIVVYFIFLYSRDKGWGALAFASKWYLIIAGILIALPIAILLIVLIIMLLLFLISMFKMHSLSKKRPIQKKYIDVEYKIKK